MYWLIGRGSKLDLYSKGLLYQTIIRPIWTYGIQLWGCAKKANRLVIQRVQNKILRMLTDARWYQRNEDLHSDLNLRTVEEVIRDFSIQHERRLHEYDNIEALQLLDNSLDVRRLKRYKPYDLVVF